jgi:hypothetical protein
MSEAVKDVSPMDTTTGCSRGWSRLYSPKKIAYRGRSRRYNHFKLANEVGVSLSRINFSVVILSRWDRLGQSAQGPVSATRMRG